MDGQSTARFDQAASSLGGNLHSILLAVPESAKRTAQEIRLRVGAPIALTCPEQIWFLGKGSELHNLPQNGYRVTQTDLSEAFIHMCAHSVHSHQHELRNGFVSLKGGHRAGICGTAVLSGGELTTIRDLTSVNLRIARELRGAADPIMEKIFRQGLHSILLAGPPTSGKTTLLRDLARQLSSGRTGRFYKVAVVDERCEIAAVWQGIPQNNLGPGCDVLSAYPKGEGIRMAVRTLSPHIILCDEIGGGTEPADILEGMHCGVRFIATAHAENIGDLCRRGPVRRLLEQGVFEKVVLLGGETPGTVRDIWEAGELFAQADRNDTYRSLHLDDRGHNGLRFIQAGLSD